MFKYAVMLMVLALAGCAAPSTQPLALDHPGNPEAEASAQWTRPNPVSLAVERHMPAAEAKPAANENVHVHPAAHEAPTAPLAARYACPMHPDVVSADPKATCPKCGMRLELVAPTAEAQP